MNVSLCVVAYNEGQVLNSLFNDFINQDFPHNQIEIVLIDSNSTDNTKQIMLDFANSQHDFLRVKVLDNPKRKQSCGWNVAIREFSEDVIIRIDAHASISKNFVTENVRVLESGEYVSGGPRPNINETSTPWTETLLLAEQSMFGSSIAPYRNKQEKMYVNSLFHGAYRRCVFDKVGEFNENLGRTEDNEIHYRIREAGFKICFDPKIISYQHIRSDLKKMIKQKYGNGYWIGKTLFICPKCLSCYHFVPFLFVIAILFTSLISIFGVTIFSIIIWLLYSLLALLMSVASVFDEKKYIQQILLPIIFLILHISYGIGTCVGICNNFFKRKIRKS